MGSTSDPARARAPDAPRAAGAVDPVCGMSVRADTPHRLAHAGGEILFCGARCLERFRADPERFAAGAPPPAPAVAAGAVFTCPMHPEVRQRGPGSGPISGMALEPLLATAAEEAADPELRDMTRRLGVAVALAAPLLALAMGDMLPGRPVSARLPAAARAWLELALAT